MRKKKRNLMPTSMSTWIRKKKKEMVSIVMEDLKKPKSGWAGGVSTMMYFSKFLILFYFD